MGLDREAMSGDVRTTTPRNVPEGNGFLSINNRGDQIIAQGLPAYSELVRLGQTWQCSIPTGSAFAHVAAWPTTRAEFVLFNGEAPGGPSYVIHSAWGANVATSITAPSAYTLLGQIVTSGAAPTNNTDCLITSRSGKATYTGKAMKALADTSYAVASKWEVLASVPAGPAVSVGLAVSADIQGGVIVPPGALLLLNLVAGTATGTATVGVVWSEVQLHLG